ncbi:MAG: response regulator transcription factor [Clostridiales bacterium]|nr:response regulator transcription factor [Clostridiales bacterium]
MHLLKLLIVDDEQKIRELIGKYAAFEGYGFLEAADGIEAVQKVRTEQVDLVILDIMMPELDGFSAAKEIRRIREDLPIIMLSARGEEYEKIYGFELGVDDYVVKPFSPRELMMRVAAVMRRSHHASAENAAHETVNIGAMEVDFTARRVTIEGRNIDLSPKEYELLFFMVRNRGIALSRDKLISEIWGFDFFGDDRTLDTHIKLLRKRLGSYASYITTLRGVGYRFEKEV